MSNDHKKRLQTRLEWEGFSETKVKSDGNCQFSSLADQLFSSSDLHENVRERIVKQLKSSPKSYKARMEMDSSKKRAKNVPKDFSEYVKNMSRTGEWGNEVTLQAAADTFEVKIQLITSFKEYASMEILPRSQKFKSVIYLSYLAGVHFNSIHLKGGSEIDTASMELQGKNTNENENEKDKNENKNDKDKGKDNEKNDKDKDNGKNESENEDDIDKNKDESENEDDIDKNKDKDSEKKKKNDKNKRKKK